MDNTKREEYFAYLTALRDSGKINMYGAVSYLRMKFPKLTEDEARDILFAWMDSF